ncbi:NAD(P)/FAD-dependent oxidoreductase [Planomonospora sp. ID91781]|uniref:Monooxygenase n=3 Tax=Planomonospora TaxID=1998 RepID=A0A171DI18_9ACTN|nr:MULTISPECIES: NAD(P)/FAD-dependent oxidoreductase [Planomonospora]MBG0823825.1 NAD(P)/FAD-dependent oxidoreductase [Planomonospora sp. ID91781]GAT68606.1 monooxygenase [Planomonospora sphaerica]GGK66493.1 oxidoreductase [Planomonospora parontospora]GII08492.1 oxidoreductase [Planomonospora parontospora subsp. parontospora]
MIDVLVAGGGPAGLATAIHAARAGMEAVVVEPRPGPVDKACGEGLMPTGAAVLRSMGVEPAGRPLRGIRYLDGRHQAQAAFRGGTGLGVRRTALHAALSRRAAELGVRVVPGRVSQLRQHDDGVEAAGFRARWLVAADGLHSPLRAALGLELPGAGPRRYGLRRHYATAPWSDFVEVHWAAGGEAYVTPVGDGLVGVAVLTSRRGGYAERLSEFPALLERLDCPAATPVRGAGPLRQRVRARVAGRVLLVGDAAGYTDALTGEGVSLALLSAQALVRCLRAGTPQAYESAWLRLSRRHRLLTGALLAARRHRASARLIVPAARRLPAVFGAAVQALA